MGTPVVGDVAADPRDAQAFRCPGKVRFGDVDHAGVVFYPRFFVYFHVAFEELFEAAYGRHYKKVFEDEGVGFPVVHLEADYRRPLRFGDRFEIELGVADIGERSATLRYRLRKDGETETAVEGRVKVACVAIPDFRSTPIPPPLRALFEAHRIAP